MSQPSLTLVRHGQTEWSENGRHTSVTDLPLLESGRARASQLAQRLDPSAYARVLSSPRSRALETAALAGFSSESIEVIEDLAEWSYGEYEGLRTAEIVAERPGWDLWRDGCPGGESPDAVSRRVDRVIAAATEAEGEVILFAHGHILRALGARWLGEEVAFGERLILAPASLSRLASSHGIRALERWNEVPG